MGFSRKSITNDFEYEIICVTTEGSRPRDQNFVFRGASVTTTLGSFSGYLNGLPTL